MSADTTCTRNVVKNEVVLTMDDTTYDLLVVGVVVVSAMIMFSTSRSGGEGP